MHRGLPEGEHTAKVPKVLRPPEGEAYASVESARGELGVHLVSDGSDTAVPHALPPAVALRLQAGEADPPGIMLADVVVAIGSLDIVLGEIDR